MGLFLAFLFIAVPVAEIYVIIQVGQLIGVAPTIALMLLSAVVGAYLLRSQGRQAWRRFNETMAQRRVPAREVFDGAMIIFGGALLLTPGFLTDILGITLLLPPGRAVVRRLARGAAARTPRGRPLFFVYDRMPGTGPRRPPGTGGGPGQTGSGARGPRPAAPRRPPRAYDVEGSAQEIDEAGEGLGRGEQGPEEGAERG